MDKEPKIYNVVSAEDEYHMHARAYMPVKDGERVAAGDVVAMLQELLNQSTQAFPGDLAEIGREMTQLLNIKLIYDHMDEAVQIIITVATRKVEA